MIIHWYTWVNMGKHGLSWVYMGRVYMGIHGLTWVNMCIHGYT